MLRCKWLWRRSRYVLSHGLIALDIEMFSFVTFLYWHKATLKRSSLYSSLFLGCESENFDILSSKKGQKSVKEPDFIHVLILCSPLYIDSSFYLPKNDSLHIFVSFVSLLIKWSDCNCLGLEKYQSACFSGFKKMWYTFYLAAPWSSG